MENRNLEKALDLASLLIQGDEVTEQGSHAALYQEYSTNAEVYDLLGLVLKKLNLQLYEYRNGLYVCPKEGDAVFGFSNEQLRRELGVRVNRELYLAYFVIYQTITEFYHDTAVASYTEFVRVEDVIRNMDLAVAGIIDRKSGLVLDEIEENSFRELALSWDELPVTTAEEQAGMRAARNSRYGFVKMVFNFLQTQKLLVENAGRFYPTNRFRALIENYFDANHGRFAELLYHTEKTDMTVEKTDMTVEKTDMTVEKTDIAAEAGEEDGHATD